jgi:RHS repeat-associated protein
MKTKHALARVLFAALAFAAATAAFAASSDTQYHLNDHLATTVGIVDAAGEIAALEADAFGSPLAAGQAPSRYTGKPYDEDLGAFVFPFRNYRAEEGRWMSADPSGFPDGVNARNLNAGILDPLGLFTVNPAQGTSPSSTSHNYSGTTYIIKANSITHVNPANFSSIDGWSGTISNGGVRPGDLTPTVYRTGYYESRLNLDIQALYEGVSSASGYQYRWLQMISTSDNATWRPDGAPFYPLSSTADALYRFKDAPGRDPTAPALGWDFSKGAYKWNAKLFLVQVNSSTNELIVHDGISYGFRIHKE